MNTQTLRGTCLRALLLICCLLVLSGCTTWRYKMVGGCGTVRFSQEFIDEYVQKIEWTGACDDDGLATGKGVFTAVLKDGTSIKYEGEMRDGVPHGDGTETYPDGERYTGDFMYGTPGYGKRYAPDGTLLYEGSFHYNSHKYEKGKMYESDGGTVEGSFEKDSDPTNRYSSGIIYAEVREKDGQVAYWVCDGVNYNSEQAYHAAVQQHEDAATAAEQAEYAQQQAQQDADDAAYAQQLGNVLTAVATVVAANNGAPAPAPTPAPQYAPPPAARPYQPAPAPAAAAPAAAQTSAAASYLFPTDPAPNCAEYTFLGSQLGHKYFQIKNVCNYTIVFYVKVIEDGRWTTYSDMAIELRPQIVAKSYGVSDNFQAMVMADCASKDTMEWRLGKKLTGVYTQNNGAWGCWGAYENTGVGTGN